MRINGIAFVGCQNLSMDALRLVAGAVDNTNAIYEDLKAKDSTVYDMWNGRLMFLRAMGFEFHLTEGKIDRVVFVGAPE